MSAMHISTVNGSRGVPARYWIQSPQYDLAFFILSPLLGLLAVLPNEPNVLAMVIGTMLGIPHYISTFTFYGWDENRPYHRARWLAFFLGPAVIILMFIGLVLFRIPYIIQVTIYCWNIFHVARQSCGLLSLYRHRAACSTHAIKPSPTPLLLLAMPAWHSGISIGIPPCTAS